MYLDAIKLADETAFAEQNGIQHQSETDEKWRDWQVSQIAHHGASCCELARQWIASTDVSELGGADISTSPYWLRRKFKPEAAACPLVWCEAVKKDALDCGAVAALAAEIFNTRGVKTLRVQLVRRFFAQFSGRQSNSGYDICERLRRMNDDLIYREGCAIVAAENKVKIWDAETGWWINPHAANNGGALLAVRLSAGDLSSETLFTWGNHRLNALRWTKIHS